MMLAGASAVAVGTALLTTRPPGPRIAAELPRRLAGRRTVGADSSVPLTGRIG